MNNQLVFEPVLKKAINQKRRGCINVDVDTMAFDLKSGLYLTRDLKLADISWNFSLPRILELFEKANIKATFFIIGRHLELASCRKRVKEIANAGHELANHTMNHTKQFSLLPRQEIEREIRECHDRLSDVTGRPPVGFRAPGYTINKNVIEVLQKLRYKYDASLNVSRLYNTAKAMYRRFIIREKDILLPQDLKGLPPPDKTYRARSKELVEAEDSLLLFPINIIPMIHYTFTSGSLIGFGKRVTRLAYRTIRNRIDVLNFELHDIEFSNLSDVKNTKFRMPSLSSRYARIPMEKRERYFIEAFKLFRNDFKLTTFSEIIGEI